MDPDQEELQLAIETHREAAKRMREAAVNIGVRLQRARTREVIQELRAVQRRPATVATGGEHAAWTAALDAVLRELTH